MNNNTFTKDDLKSGYVVEFRCGNRRMVARAGSFTKILVNPETGSWNYLSHWRNDLTLNSSINCNANENKALEEVANQHLTSADIVRVYGLVQGTERYGMCLCLTDPSFVRPLLWERKEVVKMTVAEICEKLGYEVEIVAEK